MSWGLYGRKASFHIIAVSPRMIKSAMRALRGTFEVLDKGLIYAVKIEFLH